ncbi:MAG: response regulator transcription factor [Acidobacteriota bacterium]
MNLLLVEDDPVVAAFVAKGLRQEGHAVDVAADGSEGLSLAMSKSYDVLVVDRMLPGLDGLALVKALRATDNQTPVLILSALADVAERVKGLSSGADDYLVKPFAFSELSARVTVLAKRSGPTPRDPVELTVADLTLDLLSREALRGKERIELKPREYQLLEYLMRHAGQVVTRTMLLERVWGYHFDPTTNVIDQHISQLRKKIDREFDAKLIHTVRGAGYVLRAPE